MFCSSRKFIFIDLLFGILCCQRVKLCCRLTVKYPNLYSAFQAMKDKITVNFCPNVGCSFTPSPSTSGTRSSPPSSEKRWSFQARLEPSTPPAKSPTTSRSTRRGSWTPFRTCSSCGRRRTKLCSRSSFSTLNSGSQPWPDLWVVCHYLTLSCFKICFTQYRRNKSFHKDFHGTKVVHGDPLSKSTCSFKFSPPQHSFLEETWITLTHRETQRFKLQS